MSSIIKQEFAKRLLYYRKKRGYTQADLAAVLDINRECISKLERGIIDPRLSTIYRLANALEIDKAEFVKDNLTNN